MMKPEKMTLLPRLMIAVVFASFCFSSCAPSIKAKVQTSQPALAAGEYVLVVPEQEEYDNDGIKIGTIKGGDNGFSINCTYTDVIEKLKVTAREKGANLIRITSHKRPDHFSTCNRIIATLYRVPNVYGHEKEIIWSRDRKLSWSDFKGIPIISDSVGARTGCGFGFATSRVALLSKAKYYTYNVFYTNISWVRPTERNNMQLLQHEQTHFDISEVYARKLRKSLLDKKLNVFTLSEGSKKVFDDVWAEFAQRQKQFDDETRHGLDTAMQVKWIYQISAELLALDPYATETLL